MSEERPVQLWPVEHDPFAGEAPAEAAPQRRGLIQQQDLEGLFPEHERVAGPWRPGTGTYPVDPRYSDWLDMDKKEAGSGLHVSPDQLQGAWNDGFDWVRGFSPEQREAVDKYFADYPETKPPSPEDEDRALRLPAEARYWYELSSRGMAHEAPNENGQHMMRFYNLVAGTSPSAEPEVNYRRALGAMAEHYQRLPIDTDIVSPELVRKLAFAPEDPTAPKTGNFGNTFGYIGGYVPKPPLSTNGRQIANRLNIDPDFLAEHPWMYAGISKFYQNYRDLENATNPAIRSGEANPYETWQLQAPGWVDTRNQQQGWTGTERNDDYLAVQNRLKPELEKAGIDTSPGLLSHEVLSQPNLPDLMSTTRERYLQSPVMTLETNTTMTPEGRRAADLFNSLPAGEEAVFARNARADYEAIQRRAMRRLTTTGGGKFPSVLENMASAALGRNVKMPRSDTKAWGTYGDTISPNLRVPMWAVHANGDRTSLPDPVIRLMLGGLGNAAYQEAVPASRFRTIEEQEPPETTPQTYSLFLHEHDRPQTPVEQIHDFGRQLGPAYPLSISRSPNGTLIDIHNIAGEPWQSLSQRVVDTADQVFPEIEKRAIGRGYTSYYMMHPETIEDPIARADPTQSYQAAHDAFWEQAHATDRPPSPNEPRRVREAYRSAERRLGDYTQAVAQARAIADTQGGETQQWTNKYAPRLARWRERAEAARLASLSSGAGTTLAGLGSLAGALAAAPQFAQPPPAPGAGAPPPGALPTSRPGVPSTVGLGPRLIPVEHDPYAADVSSRRSSDGRPGAAAG